jgi:4-diphosphocytidyl-2-C-methyl-D-erythritol kinase
MKAPAKINYDLFITGRREDGYHLLNSKFIPIENLHDDVEIDLVGVSVALEVSRLCGMGTQKKKWKVGAPLVGAQGRYWRNKWHFKTPKISLEIVGNSQIPNDKSNLVWKAAEAFLNYVRKPLSIKIKLTKRIPVSAGLGGGSSDAAAVLKLLNQQFPIPKDRLIKIAASIGADVPFFLESKPAIVSGIGELIEPIEAPEKLPILLISPKISISAAEAYKLYKKSDVEFSKIDRTNPKNDLEKPVLNKYIALRLIRSELEKIKTAKEIRMTGSGSTFFMTFDSVEDAEQAQQELHSLKIAECGMWITEL